MIIMRNWRRVHFGKRAHKHGCYKVTHMKTGYFLFGIIPLYISTNTTFYPLNDHVLMK